MSHKVARKRKTSGYRYLGLAVGPFCNYQFDVFDSWCVHESEIQVHGNQRFSLSRCFMAHLHRFAALSRLRKDFWDQVSGQW